MPLGRLDLAYCREVTNLQPLHGMPLRVLILEGTSVRDVSASNEFRTLEHLDLSSTKVSDLSPLQGLRLKTLRIDYTTVADLAP